LPPAVILTAQYDPLRDEGNAYATALTAAGNQVVSFEAEDMSHGFVLLLNILPQASEWLQRIAASLKQVLQQARTPAGAES
jgi:acetyl esterase